MNGFNSGGKAGLASRPASAWVPWFGPNAAADGAKSDIKNIDKLDVIYLFTYEVEADGTIVNRANYNADHWQDLFEEARDNDVKLIPTIAWFYGDQIHSVLSDRSDRRKQVNDIIKIVEDGDFDAQTVEDIFCNSTLEWLKLDKTSFL